MTEEKKIKFSFDANKTHKIRRAIDERAIFATETERETNVKKDKKNRVRRTFCAYDVIYASLNRIEDTLMYINTMELGTEAARRHRGAFDFYDFLNNMYVVIHCIKTLGKVFKVEGDKFKEIEMSTECFNKHGITGSGSDDDFFEYVRSLISVHPSDTGMHPEYNGYGGIHCSPFAVWTIDKPHREGDICVHIYTSEKDGDIETLALWVNHFEKYLERWLDFIDVIVDAVKIYNSNKAEAYIHKQIKSIEKFESYDKYIENLKKELVIRTDSYNEDILDYYAEIFRMSLSDEVNKPKFELYKNAIKYSLEFLHKRMQNMDNDGITNTGIIYPERNLETELYIELWKPRFIKSEISEYGYELEKLNYINGSGSYDDRYGRRLMNKLIPIINKYVIFTNKEPAFETQVLVSMALYFESLRYRNILNRNIPNTLEYREQVLTQKELEEIMKEDIKENEISHFRRFIAKYNISYNGEVKE